MTHLFLCKAHIDACYEEVGGKSVPKIMDAEILDPGSLAGCIPCLLGRGLVGQTLVSQKDITSVPISDDDPEKFDDLRVESYASMGVVFCVAEHRP